jgi:hypothetical protein
MACRPAAFFISTISVIFGLCGVAALALPFLKASDVCNVELSQIRTLHAFPVLLGTGFAFLILATVGCALSRTGLKRYKFPFVTVLLFVLAVLGATAVYLRDPSRAADLHEQIDNLQAEGTKELYHDFGLLYSAGNCAKQGSEIVCKQSACLPTHWKRALRDSAGKSL